MVRPVLAHAGTRRGAPPVAPLPSLDLSLAFALTLTLIILLIAAESLVLTVRHPNVWLPFDRKETAFLLDGFHAIEQDHFSSYRWTAGRSQVRFYQPGQGRGLALGLRLGPHPPDHAITSLQLDYGGAAAITLATASQPRHYRFLVPPNEQPGGNLVVNLRSRTTTVPPDPRPIGVRVRSASLTFLDTPVVFPSPWLMTLQALFLALLLLLLHRLDPPPLVVVVTLLAAGLLLLLLFIFEGLLLFVYLMRLATALGILAVLTWALLPLAERHASTLASPRLVRTVWAVALLACLMRLGGSLYPLFAAYDLSLNVERLLKTLHGTLIMTSPSIEFRNHLTVYPPGPYVLLLPGMLARIPPGLLVMGGIAIIDGFGALTVAALARALGASRNTTIFSALFYAAVPINLTALWWGLTAQIFGQALMLPLAVVLLVAFRQPRPATWTAAGGFLVVALLSHIGVTILAVAWLGLLWLFLGWRQTIPRRAWWHFALMLATCCLVSGTLVYSAVAGLKLEESLKVGEKVLSERPPVSYALIFRGFLIAFHRMGLVLLGPGLLLLLRRRLPTGGLELVGSWLLVLAFFCAVEMATALQVRYIYALTPLACLAAGLVLSKLAARGRLARATVWGILVLLLVQGGISWYQGAFEDVMMSVSSLVR
ncbi:MAG: hypothetical protein HC884_18355 [Chloroflexaceae bacterium]|nr:hypothetical protein [Chloroflexaceae bacterium]